MNNGHFSRQNHNKNRNRNRNRRHSGGGGGNTHGGGSGGNRVLDSNGPDVKLRGTAQTIAEKYIQLGRDAQLAGDNVMAESYYQHGEHYYRVWLANQPAGAPVHFARRPGDDEYEDEGGGEGVEGDDESVAVDPTSDVSDAPEASGADASENTQATQDGQQQGRQFRPRDGNKDGGRDNSRDRPRNRWPRRNDRNSDQPRDGEAPVRAERTVDDTETGADAAADWGDTPSFLTRPVPVVQTDAPVEVNGTSDQPVAESRPRREFRPRKVRETPVPGDVPVARDD